MVNFQELGGYAQQMLDQSNNLNHNSNSNSNSNQQFGSASKSQGGNEDDVKATVSGNLVSMLGGSGAPQGTTSRGLGSFIGGLTSSATIDESRVNAAHEKAYNQGGAQDMSNQDLGAAAGKEVFDMIFGGGSSGSRDRSVGGQGNGELATEVTQLFGTAATEQQQQQSGTTDRGFGSSILSSITGAAQGGQPQRQKDTFEKIVDLISKEVAKFMGGNANKNDVAAAATQTFTQLMIKKKIYGFMGKQAPEDNPASTVQNFLGTLGVGGNNNNNNNNSGGSGSGAGGLGGLAAQFLGGGNSNQQQQFNNNQQQQSSQSQQQGGGFGALAGLAASALGGSKPQQQQGGQQQQYQQGQQQQQQYQGQQQGGQQGGQQQGGQQQGGLDFNQLLGMAGPMLSALGNGNKH